ncbi:MAG TPA: hypothetical protein ENK11_09840, partial [Phycisphaerales bacterium]|nr:hypothetical protein [Phycisphaerales bacterium]
MTEPKSWSLELPARISGLVNLNCLKNETEVSQCLAVIYPAILLTFERLVNVHRLRAEKILNDSDVQKKIEEWQGRPMNEIVGDKKIAIRRSCHPDDITRIINQQSVTFEGDEVSQALDLP